jgi:hypothetical protein
MKLSTCNPVSMKKINLPDFHFTAYPLKALKPSAADKKTILHVYTGEKGIKKYVVNTKVHPMVNPYPEKMTTPAPEKKSTAPFRDHIEDSDTDWFASYE